MRPQIAALSATGTFFHAGCAVTDASSPCSTTLSVAGADHAGRGLELALDQEPHGERGGVPAACRQAAEYRAARGRLVEMEGLRIEFGGEALDPLLLDPQTPGSEFLSCSEIFEVTHGHSGVT